MSVSLFISISLCLYVSLHMSGCNSKNSLVVVFLKWMNVYLLFQQGRVEILVEETRLFSHFFFKVWNKMLQKDGSSLSEIKKSARIKESLWRALYPTFICNLFFPSNSFTKSLFSKHWCIFVEILRTFWKGSMQYLCWNHLDMLFCN